MLPCPASDRGVLHRPGRCRLAVFLPRLALFALLAGPVVGCGDGVVLPGSTGGSGDGGGAPDAGSAGDGALRPDAGLPAACRWPAAPGSFVAGRTYFGKDRYIQYLAGDLPIVLSAPHGGYLTPSSLKDRTYGVRGRDSYSLEYTLMAAHEILRITGRLPHVVVNRLHRRKLDANREIKEAAQGDPAAEQAWREYHAFIDAAKAWVNKHCTEGMYHDLHTNAHKEHWVELGFLLRSSDLARSDAALDADPALRVKSSVRALASRPGASLSAIVRGPASVGALLQARGFKSVPSPAHPDPAGGGYFNGGYNTARHGSRSGGTIDGAQVETYYGMIDTTAERTRYARALAESIVASFQRLRGVSLKDPAWRPPAHGRCAAAITLTPGSAPLRVAGSTAGASVEHDGKVTCGTGFGLYGPQVYYRLVLEPGRSYRLTLQADFPARPYLFGERCDLASIEASCRAGPIRAPLVPAGTSATFTVRAAGGGRYTLAVGSRSTPYWGAFILTVTPL